MSLRRARFRDVIERQLDGFAADEASLLAECGERERAYDRAGRDEAEEAYGDYSDALDAAADALAARRDAYASTLTDRAAEAYEAEFDRAARRRWPAVARDLGAR